jgi:putative redox protein
MECTIDWLAANGMAFSAETGSGHLLTMDGAPDGGGRNLAPRPMETVLAGTGACAAYDVVLILKRGRHDIRGCTVKLTSERAATDPKVFTPENLARYRGVVFLSAEGVALSNDQESALQNYIKAGNGYLGIADAAKFQPDSEWMTGLIGTRPVGALPPALPASAITASAENPPNETKDKLNDGQDQTKWLTFANSYMGMGNTSHFFWQRGQWIETSWFGQGIHVPPFNIDMPAMRDIIVSGIYGVMLGLNIFLFAAWQKRNVVVEKPAQDATPVKRSRFGRPLRRGAGRGAAAPEGA